ncbi:uncharacterized protein ARMOST_05037 [Armillaria ostoyae]|uniref:Uncharacterized protein n=1 Tax=Armillaria ostoyae TaxID=47428 RepID=A0A284QZ03_ARMOS|nr:uncharacterized protein ARMOST_05037 [Armillaria ostoyae]
MRQRLRSKDSIVDPWVVQRFYGHGSQRPANLTFKKESRGRNTKLYEKHAGSWPTYATALDLVSVPNHRVKS